MPRYHFLSGGLSGSAGEIPAVLIEETDLLPPIEKLDNISKRTAYSEPHELESGFIFLWQTEGDFKQTIVARVQLNDLRVKEQYREHQNDAVRQIIDTIIRQLLGPHMPEVPLSNNNTLDASEIPEALKPFVDQINIWQRVLDLYYKSPPFGAQSKIDGEGYYCLPITDDWVKIPGMYKGQVIIFNHPETINDEEVIWRSQTSGRNIRYILSHKHASRKTAEFYGYLDIFEEARRRHEELVSENDRFFNERRILDDEKERDRIEVLKKAMFND